MNSETQNPQSNPIDSQQNQLLFQNLDNIIDTRSKTLGDIKIDSLITSITQNGIKGEVEKNEEMKNYPKVI
jgi:hypothetical protein